MIQLPLSQLCYYGSSQYTHWFTTPVGCNCFFGLALMPHLRKTDLFFTTPQEIKTALWCFPLDVKLWFPETISVLRICSIPTGFTAQLSTVLSYFVIGVAGWFYVFVYPWGNFNRGSTSILSCRINQWEEAESFFLCHLCFTDENLEANRCPVWVGNITIMGEASHRIHDLWCWILRICPGKGRIMNDSQRSPQADPGFRECIGPCDKGTLWVWLRIME